MILRGSQQARDEIIQPDNEFYEDDDRDKGERDIQDHSKNVVNEVAPVSSTAAEPVSATAEPTAPTAAAAAPVVTASETTEAPTTAGSATGATAGSSVSSNAEDAMEIDSKPEDTSNEAKPITGSEATANSITDEEMKEIDELNSAT